MHNFTPLPALLGGLLIGLSATLYWLYFGRIAGISGIFGHALGDAALRPKWDETARTRVGFVLGLVTAGIIAKRVAPHVLVGIPNASLVWLAVAGVLVGVGTQLGAGCTSGHGVCGMSRGSLRSLVATLTFMAVAMLTVFGLRVLHLGNLP